MATNNGYSGTLAPRIGYTRSVCFRNRVRRSFGQSGAVLGVFLYLIFAVPGNGYLTTGYTRSWLFPFKKGVLWTVVRFELATQKKHVLRSKPCKTIKPYAYEQGLGSRHLIFLCCTSLTLQATLPSPVHNESGATYGT